jgi:hypothetical protein
MSASTSRKPRVLPLTGRIALGAFTAAFAACGGSPTEDTPPDSKGCATGEVAAGDGACVQVGIQGCAPEHIGKDGICRPLPEGCPAGTIPHFEKGCVPVGIQGCAPEFVGEDGLCRPAMDGCPGGAIPRFDTGCAPVGIEGCAPVFLEEDGHCHVRMNKCPTGTFASPLLGCVSIDGASGCGSGTWGTLVDLPGTIYVNASAPPGGADGTKQKPFVTIAAGLAVVPSGGRIVLAAGQYPEPVHVQKAVHIAGRCASLVSITGTQPVQSLNGTPVVFWFDGVTEAKLSGVRIAGDGAGILLRKAKASVEDVHVDGASAFGILTLGDGTEVVVRRTLVENVAGGSPDGTPTGIAAQDKSLLTVESSTVYHAQPLGILGTEGSEIRGKEVLVEATQPAATEPALGYGITLLGVGSLEDSAVVANREVGVLVAKGANVALTRDVIEDTLVPSPGKRAFGVSVQNGASVELSSCFLSKSQGEGIHLSDPKSSLTLRGSLIQDTFGKEPPGVGAGLIASEGTLTIEDSAFYRNRGAALYLTKGAQANVARTLVEATSGIVETVVAKSTSKATLSDCALTNNQTVGFGISGGASLEVSRCLVKDTLPEESTGKWGLGAAVQDVGSKLLLTRSVFANSHHIGVEVIYGASARVEESWITGTRPSAQPQGGIGAYVQGGALEVVGSLFSDNRGNEIAGHGADSTISVLGSVFLEVASAEPPARGLAVAEGAKLQMTSSLVRSTGGYGVGLFSASGAISRSTIERIREQSLFSDDAVADGLFVTDSDLSTEGLLISDCSRVGLFLLNVTGAVASSVSMRNRYGVVLQGTSPTLDSNAEFFNNSKTDRVVGGDLSVPDSPAPLPTP